MSEGNDPTPLKLAGKQGYHHGNLRAALLEAGRALLRDQGLAAISLRAVAKAAGVSHAAPYRHFRDKEHMLACVAEAGYEQLSDAIEAAAAVEDPAEQIQVAMVGYLRFALANRELHHLMFGGLLDRGETALVLQDARLKTFGALRAIVDAGIKSGRFKAVNAREATLTLWSLMHGFALLMSTGQLQAGGSEEQVEMMARGQASLVLDGLLKRRSTLGS